MDFQAASDVHSVAWALVPAFFPGFSTTSSTAADMPRSRVEHRPDRQIVGSTSGDVATSDDRWIAAANDMVEFEGLLDRIDHLAEKEAGWKGAESAKAPSGAIEDARVFLTHLSMLGTVELPAIGLDSDGEFSFLWRGDDFIANLSILGDGTYSYFARRGEQVARADDAKLSGGIDDALARIIAA